MLLIGEVNTGQFRYSDWLLSGQYNTVKTASQKNGIFRTTHIIKTKKKLSPVNNTIITGQSVNTENIDRRRSIDRGCKVYTQAKVNIFPY